MTAAIRRLGAEQKAMMDPAQRSPDFFAAPLDDNIYEWHFTIRGPYTVTAASPEKKPSGGTSPAASAPTEAPVEDERCLDLKVCESEPLLGYEKGLYHGALIFTPAFPYEPPDILFFTETGRFECNKKICSTISNYHKEHWQPTYHIDFILQSLREFMRMEDEEGIGTLSKDSIPRQQKFIWAEESWRYTCRKCGCSSRETYEMYMAPYKHQTLAAESGSSPVEAAAADETAASPSGALPPTSSALPSSEPTTQTSPTVHDSNNAREWLQAANELRRRRAQAAAQEEAKKGGGAGAVGETHSSSSSAHHGRGEGGVAFGSLPPAHDPRVSSNDMYPIGSGAATEPQAERDRTMGEPLPAPEQVHPPPPHPLQSRKAEMEEELRAPLFVLRLFGYQMPVTYTRIDKALAVLYLIFSVIGWGGVWRGAASTHAMAPRFGSVNSTCHIYIYIYIYIYLVFHDCVLLCHQSNERRDPMVPLNLAHACLVIDTEAYFSLSRTITGTLRLIIFSPSIHAYSVGLSLVEKNLALIFRLLVSLGAARVVVPILIGIMASSPGPGNGSKGGPKGPPTLPPPPPPDESEVDALGQQLFMRTATTRAYPFVEGWFRDKAADLSERAEAALSTLTGLEAKEVPNSFRVIQKVRDKRRDSKETMRGKLERAYECGAYQERRGNLWLQAFARQGRRYLEELEEVEKELLQRRFQAEEWTVRGERERVLTRMLRFKEKYEHLQARMEEDVANLEREKTREEARMKLALESCLEEIRDVVSWHVLQQSRGAQGRISAARRQQLLSILGDNPGVMRKKNQRMIESGSGYSSSGTNPHQPTRPASLGCAAAGEATNSLQEKDNVRQSITEESGKDDSDSWGEGVSDADMDTASSIELGPLFAPTEEDQLCREEARRLARMLQRRKESHKKQRDAVERRRRKEVEALKNKFKMVAQEEARIVKGNNASSSTAAQEVPSVLVPVVGSNSPDPLEFVGNAPPSRSAEDLGSDVTDMSASDYFQQDGVRLSTPTRRISWVGKIFTEETATSPHGSPKMEKSSRSLHSPSGKRSPAQRGFSAKSGHSRKSTASGGRSANTPHDQPSSNSSGHPASVSRRPPPSTTPHGPGSDSRRRQHLSPATSLQDAANNGSTSSRSYVPGASTSAGALAAAATGHHYKLPPTRARELARLEKLAVPVPPALVGPQPNALPGTPGRIPGLALRKGRPSPRHHPGATNSGGTTPHTSPTTLPTIHHPAGGGGGALHTSIPPPGDARSGTLRPSQQSAIAKVASSLSTNSTSQQQQGSAAPAPPSSSGGSQRGRDLQHTPFLDGPPAAISTASGHRQPGTGLGATVAAAAAPPPPPAAPKLPSRSSPAAPPTAPPSSRGGLSSAAMTPVATTATGVSPFTVARPTAHVTPQGSGRSQSGSAPLGGEVSMSLRATELPRGGDEAVPAGDEGVEEKGDTAASHSGSCAAGKEAELGGEEEGGQQAEEGDVATDASDVEKDTARSLAPSQPSMSRSKPPIPDQEPSSALAPLKSRTEKRGYVNGKLFRLRRVVPEIVMPPASGGPNGALIPTEHFNQLVFAISQETEEMRCMVERTTSVSTALLTRLQQLKATCDQLLVQNVRLERDKEALREELRQQAEQRIAVKDAAAFCRMRDEFDCAILREEQQDAVEDLAELLRLKQAELAHTKTQIEHVSSKIKDHDELLMRVQAYWRSNANFIRRCCGEITSSNPLRRRPAGGAHQGGHSSRDLHSSRSFNGSTSGHSSVLGRHPGVSSNSGRATKTPEPYLETARPAGKEQGDLEHSVKSSSRSGKSSPMERALDMHQLHLQRQADGASAGVFRTSPRRPGESHELNSGRVEQAKKENEDSTEASISLHASPREMEEYSEGVTPIYMLQLRQMDEIAEFIHSVFEQGALAGDPSISEGSHGMALWMWWWRWWWWRSSTEKRNTNNHLVQPKCMNQNAMLRERERWGGPPVQRKQIKRDESLHTCLEKGACGRV
eukprot:gene11886-8171_t